MKALSFGEILFDVFPGYERIGGAPFNSSAHIAALGGCAEMISAVGDDELGHRAVSETAKAGVSTAFMKTSSFPTGRADIVLDRDGNADYAFNSPCAWDDITLTDSQIREIESEYYDVFIFGTLASRSPVSAATLEMLLERVNARHFFFDVNFRKDFYDREMLLKALERTTILKVNEDELPIVLSFAEQDDIASLISAYKLDYVLLTLGAGGSTLYSSCGEIHQDIIPGTVVDTVGAGDSLSAAFLFFLMTGRNEETALHDASTVSSFVVSRKGAVPAYTPSLISSLSL